MADDDRSLGSLTLHPRTPPEGTYAARRDRAIRRAAEAGRGCEPCAALAASLLVTGGELERFRHVCRVRRREDRQGIRSVEDHLIRTWRLIQIWKGRYEGGFSMRGAGARRQEFERWVGELPDGGDGGRPGLLETATGDEPDVRACLDDLEAWIRHLRGEDDPVAHVERQLQPASDEWGSVPLPSERRRLSRLARRVAEWEEARRKDRRRTPAALSRRMLADLSGGLLTPDQVARLARRERKTGGA